MASMFCKHDRLICEECGHYVDSFPTIHGETVAKQSSIKTFCQPNTEYSEPRLMTNAKTGLKDWHYYNTGLDKWCTGIKDTEEKAKAMGAVVAG